MKRCWDANHDRRPEIDEVVTMIETIDTSKGGGMISGRLRITKVLERDGFHSREDSEDVGWIVVLMVFGNLIGQVVEIIFLSVFSSVFIQVSRINSVPGWLYRLERMYCSMQGQILDCRSSSFPRAAISVLGHSTVSGRKIFRKNGFKTRTWYMASPEDERMKPLAVINLEVKSSAMQLSHTDDIKERWEVLLNATACSLLDPAEFIKELAGDKMLAAYHPTYLMK
ncbi:hypothetical protein ACET3Z_010774 [Daucus carota]